MYRIAIIDDEILVTQSLELLLEMNSKFAVDTYNDSEIFIDAIDKNEKEWDVIVSDFIMPKKNGLDVLKYAKEKIPNTMRILLTGYADKENAIKAINEAGLYYYMEKPWDNQQVISVIENAADKKYMKKQLEIKNRDLEESNNEISRLYNLLKSDYDSVLDGSRNLLVTLSNIIEAKDKYTDSHTHRVAKLSRAIGIKIGLDKKTVDDLEYAGFVHDIGKIGVPDYILNKDSSLTDAEFEEIKKHPSIGEKMLRPLKDMEGVLDAVRHHHEKLNGSGYPDKLKGDEISISARIVAVADIFDALYSDRSYRKALSIEKVEEIMKKEALDKLIDKDMVNVLFDMINEDGSVIKIK